MGFTHYTPTAQRLYGTAYSASTTHQTVLESPYSSFEQTSTNFAGTTAVEALTSWDSAGKRYTTNSGTADRPNRVITGVSRTTNSGSSHTFNFSKDYSVESYSNFDTLTSVSAREGASSGRGASSTELITEYNSTGYASVFRSGETQETNQVTYSQRQGPDSDDNYSTFEFGSTMTRGSTSYQVSEREGSSGSSYTQVIVGETTTNNTGSPPISPPTTNSDEGTFNYNPGDVVMQIATSLGTKQVYSPSYNTETNTTSTSYSYFLENLLETSTSSYQFNTTKNLGTETDSQTHAAYETENETLTSLIDGTYRIFTIHGGGAFVTGGSILPNRAVTGATLTTIVSYPPSLATAFNQYVTTYYTGADIKNSINGIRSSNAAIDTITTVSSEETKIRTTLTTLSDPADFGRSTSEAKIFETTTYRFDFKQKTNSSGQEATLLTVEVSAGTAEFSAYTTAITTLTKSFMGSNGFSSYSYGDIISKDTTYATGIQPAQTAINSSRTAKATVGKLPVTLVSHYTTESSRFSFWTFDKGDQGGIQNEKSSNVSGAVRSTRPITIADEVITSTTYTSPAATINITANSAESQSYTSSAGLALGLELKLNRYLTYFPHEVYGNVVSSIDSMQYSYSNEGIGSSIIRFTSTGVYSTSNITQNTDTTFTGPVNSATSRNTRSFSSELLGIAKIGLGVTYPNGQKTKPLLLEKAGKGGHKFASTEGVLVYRNDTPPFTFAIHGESSSSIVSIDAGSIGGDDPVRTLTLPIGSVCFHAGSTFVKAAAGAGVLDGGLTYDRKHRQDAGDYYYSSSYYYYGYYGY